MIKRALKFTGKVGVIASEEEDAPVFNKDAYRHLRPSPSIENPFVKSSSLPQCMQPVEWHIQALVHIFRFSKTTPPPPQGAGWRGQVPEGPRRHRLQVRCPPSLSPSRPLSLTAFPVPLEEQGCDKGYGKNLKILAENLPYPAARLLPAGASTPAEAAAAAPAAGT